MTFGWLLLAPLAAAGATIPPGQPVDDGVTLVLGNDGITFVGEQASNLFDQHIPVSYSKSISCGGFGTLTYSVFPGIDENALDIEFGDLTLTPRDGSLQLSFDAIGRGTGVDGGLDDVVARYTLNGCTCSCGGSLKLPVTPFTGTMSAALALEQDGSPALSINSLSLNIPTPDLSYSGCESGLCGFALGFWLDDVASQTASIAEQEISNYIESTTLLELNAALSTMVISTVASVDGAPLSIDVLPTSVSVTSNAGITISAQTTYAALQTAPCASAAGSASTTAAGTSASPTSLARLSVTGDAINQLLSAIWQGGTLCRRVDEIGDMRLTVGALAVLGFQEAAASLGLSDSTPVSIELRPASAPTIRLDGAEPLLVVDDLDIRFLAEVEERIVRLASVQIDAELGFTVALGSTTSTKLRLASLTVASIDAAPAYDEILGEDAALVLANELEPLVTAWLPVIADSLPAVDLGNPGVRLRDLLATPGGNVLDLDSGLAPAGGGCSAAGGSGCGVEGCQLGPARSQGPWGSLVLAAVATLGIALRRRR